MFNRLFESKYFVVSVIPLYVLMILIAHIFSCIWFYVSDTTDPDGWIVKSGFRDEGIYDRYWVCLYFIYTTLTTTGYGDIVPGTFWEFFWTIVFMGVGVTVHSLIYTTMLSKFEEYNRKYTEFTIKKDLLLDLRRGNFFN